MAEICGGLDEAADHREDGQDDQGNEDPEPRAVLDVPLLVAEEDDEDEPERVERGEEGADGPGRPQPRARRRRRPGGPQDQVLAVEAGGHQRQRRQRGGPDEKGPEDRRQPLSQPAHLEDVLLVVERR